MTELAEESAAALSSFSAISVQVSNVRGVAIGPRTSKIDAHPDASPPVLIVFDAALCTWCAAIPRACRDRRVDWSGICVVLLHIFSLYSLCQRKMGMTNLVVVVWNHVCLGC